MICSINVYLCSICYFWGFCTDFHESNWLEFYCTVFIKICSQCLLWTELFLPKSIYWTPKHQCDHIWQRPVGRLLDFGGHSEKWLSISQGKSSHWKATLLALWSWTFILRTEKIDFCFVRPPVYLLLWQPEQANTVLSLLLKVV